MRRQSAAPQPSEDDKYNAARDRSPSPYRECPTGHPTGATSSNDPFGSESGGMPGTYTHLGQTNVMGMQASYPTISTYGQTGAMQTDIPPTGFGQQMATSTPYVISNGGQQMANPPAAFGQQMATSNPYVICNGWQQMATSTPYVISNGGQQRANPPAGFGQQMATSTPYVISNCGQGMSCPASGGLQLQSANSCRPVFLKMVDGDGSGYWLEPVDSLPPAGKEPRKLSEEEKKARKKWGDERGIHYEFYGCWHGPVYYCIFFALRTICLHFCRSGHKNPNGCTRAGPKGCKLWHGVDGIHEDQAALQAWVHRMLDEFLAWARAQAQAPPPSVFVPVPPMMLLVNGPVQQMPMQQLPMQQGLPDEEVPMQIPAQDAGQPGQAVQLQQEDETTGGSMPSSDAEVPEDEGQTP